MAAGVGLKTAAALLRKYGSLEQLIAAGRFQAQAKQLRLYRSIATMDSGATSRIARPETDLGSRGGTGAELGIEQTGGPARCHGW